MSDDRRNDNKDKGLNRRNLLLNATALSSLGAVAATVGGGDALAQQARPAAPKMGEVLPILPPKQPPITEPDWRKVPQPKPFQVRPPKGAPNVLIVLLDQTCYCDPSTFGGPINFPTLDRLAKEGLTYTNFHVNSLCSPSRTALLTGRNQHQYSQAAVVDGATSYPGRYRHAAEERRDDRRDPAPMGLLHVHVRQEPRDPAVGDERQRAVRPLAGPQGFEKFYGFIGGEKSLFNPYLSTGRPSSGCRATRTTTSTWTSRTRPSPGCRPRAR